MNSVQEWTMKFNPKMKVNFAGGDLTSDAGLLLYSSIHLSLSEREAALSTPEPRNSKNRRIMGPHLPVSSTFSTHSTPL